MYLTYMYVCSVAAMPVYNCVNRSVFLIEKSAKVLISLQVLERAADVGSGLLNLGYESSQDTFVGIYATNKAEVHMYCMLTPIIYCTCMHFIYFLST